jgi:hypothetical protein
MSSDASLSLSGMNGIQASVLACATALLEALRGDFARTSRSYQLELRSS